MCFEGGEDGFPSGSEGSFFFYLLRWFHCWHFPSEFRGEFVEGVESDLPHYCSKELSKIGYSKGLLKFFCSKFFEVGIALNIVCFEGGDDRFLSHSEGNFFFYFLRWFHCWHFPSEFLGEFVEGVESDLPHYCSKELSKIGFSKGLVKFFCSQFFEVGIALNVMCFEGGEDGFPGGSEGFFLRRFYCWYFPSELLREFVEVVEVNVSNCCSEECSKIGFSKGLVKFY